LIAVSGEQYFANMVMADKWHGYLDAEETTIEAYRIALQACVDFGFACKPSVQRQWVKPGPSGYIPLGEVQEAAIPDDDDWMMTTEESEVKDHGRNKIPSAREVPSTGSPVAADGNWHTVKDRTEPRPPVSLVAADVVAQDSQMPDSQAARAAGSGGEFAEGVANFMSAAEGFMKVPELSIPEHHQVDLAESECDSPRPRSESQASSSSESESSHANDPPREESVVRSDAETVASRSHRKPKPRWTEQERPMITIHGAPAFDTSQYMKQRLECNDVCRHIQNTMDPDETLEIMFKEKDQAEQIRSDACHPRASKVPFLGPRFHFSIFRVRFHFFTKK
jgi:hypothetical protein